MVQSLKQLINVNVVDIATNASDLSTAQILLGTELADVKKKVTDEESRALEIEGPLRSELNAEVTRATDKDTALQSEVDVAKADILINKTAGDASLAQEISDRVAAVTLEKTERQSDVAQEVLDRNAAIAEEALVTSNAIAQEVMNRNGAISYETDARVLLASKVCFAHALEYEGILVDGEYPMSAGYGVPSAPGFGVSMPFGYRLAGWSMVCKSGDNSASVSVVLEHYDFGEYSSSTVLDAATLNGNTNYISRTVESAIMPAGSVCLKIGAVGNLVDPEARYRVSLYLQADEAL
jgi:hypothetical protein